MEDNVNIKQSWCEGWARRSLIVAIYHTRRLSWCKRWLPTSSSHHSHKNCQEAEETEGIMSIMVWERNAYYCSPTPIPEQAKKLKNWWRNEGKKRRNNISAQMSFLGAVTTMSSSGSYPVTPVASQLYSSTLVAHHLLRSRSRRYTSVKYDPWSNPYTVLTTPCRLPCLDMSSPCIRYISYLVSFSPDLT